MANKRMYIKCPVCGYNYLPGEIFLPKYFVGQPTNIARVNGKIIDFDGIEQDLTELYICDNCYTPFNIQVSMIATTEPSKSRVINKKVK